MSIVGTVVEHFEISGKGTGVRLDREVGFPLGSTCSAKVSTPSGMISTFSVSKEWLLRAGKEDAVFLLMGALKHDVPIGSTIEFKQFKKDFGSA